MRLRTAIVIVVLAGVSAGCASVRENYTAFREGFATWRHEHWGDLLFEDPARVDLVIPGTTKQQVRTLLGEPHEQRSLNGEETWTYKSYRTIAKAYVPGSNARSGTMQSLAVYVAFTREGVVKKLESEKQQW